MQHVGTQEIATRRLLLRRFALQDAEAMYTTWGNDPEVARWMRWAPHANVQATREYLQSVVASYQDPATYHWAIQRKEDGALLGSLGILFGAEKGEEATWQPGYCIGQAHWGRGYTAEALAAALEFFTHNTGERHLRCCHAVGNPASGRVMEKAGFVYHHDGVYEKPGGIVVQAKYYEYHP